MPPVTDHLPLGRRQVVQLGVDDQEAICRILRHEPRQVRALHGDLATTWAQRSGLLLGRAAAAFRGLIDDGLAYDG